MSANKCPYCGKYYLGDKCYCNKSEDKVVDFFNQMFKQGNKNDTCDTDSSN